MAAGIVASTLRRKAFHRRLLDGANRYQTVSVEPGHISVSPTDEPSSATAHGGWTSLSSSHGAGGSAGSNSAPGSAGVRRSASIAAAADASADGVGGSLQSTAGGSSTPADQAAGSTQFPRGAQLSRVDFWPRCINPSETSLRRVEFETFEYVS
jgi:hypothetical protein